MSSKRKTRTPMLMLTKPDKSKSESKKSEKLKVKGLEELATKMQKRAQQIEVLSVEQKIDRKNLLTTVKQKRVEAEQNGKFCKTALVETNNKHPVKVTYKNAFSKINVEHEGELKSVLGNLYNSLYERHREVKLKADVDIEYVKQLLGDKLEALFDVTEYITPKGQFMEQRAAMRPTLNNKTNDLIDNLTDQVQHSPMVSFK